MCGFAGFLGEFGPADLQAMSTSIAHRGPDGDGSWSDPEARIGLAHRRLAIIDTSDAAAQPMAAVEGRYQVVFNGEIYNFRELGRGLRRKGYVFNENSDTAVLAPLFHEHGRGMLDLLQGIFAFAIWDRFERKLFVARDHFGVKPLYYAAAGRGFLFASELRAICSVEGFHSELDAAALRTYAQYLWSPGDATPFRSVRKLRPGHGLEVTLRGVSGFEWYSHARRERPGPARPAATAEGLRSVLRQAVADQLVADVPIGAFLSGGVDSTAVVALMDEAGRPPKRCYCVSFEGDGLVAEGFGEDWQYARAFARDRNLDLVQVRGAPPTAEDILWLVRTLEEPQADLAPLLVREIAQAARSDGLKVLMSGAGGDDVFSGYRRHVAAWLRTYARPAMAAVDRLAWAAGSGTDPLARRLKKLSYLMDGDDEEFLLRAFQFNTNGMLDRILGPALASADPVPAALSEAIGDTRGLDLIRRMLAIEFYGFLPDHNLNYVDKAAMDAAVEVRVPFLDQNVVAFAAAMRSGQFVRLGQAKWLLRKALEPVLPRAILKRRKTGFGMPLRSWIGGPLRSLLADTFSSSAFHERGLFEPAGVFRLFDDTIQGRSDGSYALFSVLMTELWCQNFYDRQPERSVLQPALA